MSRCRWPRATRWRYCTCSAVTTFRSIQVDHPIAPATLPKMRGTTPDERAQALRAGRTAARTAGKRTLRGHQPARWRSTIPTASAAQSSPTPRALRKHQARRSISSSPPRAEIRPGPDHRAYGRDGHHGHRIPQRSGPEGFRCERDVDGQYPYIAGNVSPAARSEHLPRPRGSRLSVQVWRTHHHDRPRRDPPDRAHS